MKVADALAAEVERRAKRAVAPARSDMVFVWVGVENGGYFGVGVGWVVMMVVLQ